MKAIVILFVLGLASAALGLKCYTCLNCEETNSDTPSVTCADKTSLSIPTELTGISVPSGSSRKDTDNKANDDETEDNKSDFKCFSAKVKFGDGETFVRACTKDSKCPDDKKVSECDVCSDDECNFAPGMKSWAISSIVLIAFLKMFF